MNRRGFLGLLGAFASGAVLDPDRALWVPGARLISIPSPQRFLAHYSFIQACEDQWEAGYSGAIISEARPTEIIYVPWHRFQSDGAVRVLIPAS